MSKIRYDGLSGVSTLPQKEASVLLLVMPSLSSQLRGLLSGKLQRASRELTWSSPLADTCCMCRPEFQKSPKGNLLIWHFVLCSSAHRICTIALLKELISPFIDF